MYESKLYILPINFVESNIEKKDDSLGELLVANLNLHEFIEQKERIISWNEVLKKRKISKRRAPPIYSVFDFFSSILQKLKF